MSRKQETNGPQSPAVHKRSKSAAIVIPGTGGEPQIPTRAVCLSVDPETNNRTGEFSKNCRRRHLQLNHLRRTPRCNASWRAHRQDSLRLEHSSPLPCRLSANGAETERWDIAFIRHEQAAVINVAM